MQNTESIIGIGSCPDPAQLLALMTGSASDKEAERFDAHVTSCTHCAEQIDAYDMGSDPLIRVLAALPDTTDDEPDFQRAYAELFGEPETLDPGAAADLTRSWLAEQNVRTLELPYRLGNYELLERIGAGAHGAVFRARHRRLDRFVAVKLLVHSAGEAIRDFMNEMRVIGQLDHPHIIRATDAGEANGWHFLVMEFVAGADLATLLHRAGTLSVADACEMLRQAALGLHFAHQHRLVHRDVKPSNLLFTSRGTVKLLDLGLATLSSEAVESPDGGPGLPRGTADYMPPEQWRGAVNYQSDLYSLGCTLFRLLTRRPPFRPLPPGSANLEQAHAEAPIPRFSDVVDAEIPAGLQSLLDQLLAKNPVDRPNSAAEVASRLTPYARAANLPELARTYCPAADENYSANDEIASTLIQVSPANGISRRLIISASLATASAIAGLAWWRTRASGNRVRVDNWRPLVPVHPPILVLPGLDKPQLRKVDGAGIEVATDGLAFVQWGRPVRQPYTIEALVDRVGELTPVGLFFQFRLENSESKSTYVCQSVELEPSDSTGSSVVRWQQYRFAETDGDLGPNNHGGSATNRRRDLAPEILPLADVTLAEPLPQKCQFELTIGRAGFPELSINGRLISELGVSVSTEARGMIFTNPEQRRLVGAGRIGLIQHQGKAVWGPSRLKYLHD